MVNVWYRRIEDYPADMPTTRLFGRFSIDKADAILLALVGRADVAQAWVGDVWPEVIETWAPSYQKVLEEQAQARSAKEGAA
jgi:hypothetical protein